METWIEYKRPLKTNIFSIKSGTVQIENGQTAPRHVVEHSRGAAIVAIVDGNVLFVLPALLYDNLAGEKKGVIIGMW